MKENWFVSAKKAPFDEIARTFSINPVTARIIRNRDITGEDQIRRYLNPSLDDLHDAQMLGGAQKAAHLILKKTSEGARIRIVGDYDIDGVCGSYILLKGLEEIGANVDYEIPDRMKDGYGISRRMVEQALDDGIDTILTCDNGIAAVEEISFAVENGITVIVTDHHEPREENPDDPGSVLPPAHVLVNPKLPGDPYPFKGICGAVVAWKVLSLVYRYSSRSIEDWLAFLPFAAFATIGDVMDLRDENRAIVRFGLEAMERTECTGLRALIIENGLDRKKLTPYHIGFILGPCINAGGRLDTAKRSLALLLEEDRVEAAVLARELRELNEERKKLTEQAVHDADAFLENDGRAEDKIYVIYLPDCHESIAGIVAGRVREACQHPVFVLTDSREEGMLKGSGRSIEAWNMFEALSACAPLLEKFGGHAMAAGLSLKREHLEVFRKCINENCTLEAEDFRKKILIDAPMPISYLTPDLTKELSLLEPFGKGNEKPVFAQKDLSVRKLRMMGKEGRFAKLTLQSDDGTVMEAVCFGDSAQLISHLEDKYSPAKVAGLMQGADTGIRLSVTYYPSINDYYGREELQITILSYR